VRERLAEALLLLKSTFEEKPSTKEEPFSIAISREDLASIVGTAKETVIRLLSEFKDENLVRTEGRRIFVLDSDKLYKISKLYD
jgi:CRP-like cAMP-binding protein